MSSGPFFLLCLLPYDEMRGLLELRSFPLLSHCFWSKARVALEHLLLTCPARGFPHLQEEGLHQGASSASASFAHSPRATTMRVTMGGWPLPDSVSTAGLSDDQEALCFSVIPTPLPRKAVITEVAFSVTSSDSAQSGDTVGWGPPWRRRASWSQAGPGEPCHLPAVALASVPGL